MLVGTIPSTIGNLKSLTGFFTLNQNGLTGTIPSSIGQMAAITDLNLSENQLTGAIPSGLANLKKLKKLRLHLNKLTGSVPPLPFAQYSLAGGGDCVLDVPTQCKTPDCNHFSCPLPPNSKKCVGGTNQVAVHCAYEPCVGDSSSLKPAECNAWQDLFSATNGKRWSKCSDGRLDPCSCGGSHTGQRIFDVKCANGSITRM
jgi:hypothetical protein